MMTRNPVFLVFALAALGIGCAQSDDAVSGKILSNCIGGPGIWSDLRLSSCNELIKSGKLQPADLAKAYYNRANTRLMQSEYKKAVDDYTQSLQLVKNDPSALHERCWARAVLNIDLEAALSDCNESLRLKPNDPETLGGRGFLYLQLGFYRTAILDYDAAIDAKPNTADLHYGRATAKLRAGDAEGADADFLVARAIDPKIDAVFARYDEASGGKGFWGAITDYWRAMMKWIY
ncbi:MAG: tetratricopeptide repeat protein [Micropepsaceae bacterium]